MPFLVMILGALAAAGVWYWRINNARDAIGDIADMANDVRLAARRFGFRRRNNVHPADSIDDARLAGAGIVVAVAELQGPLTQEQIDTLIIQAQSKFDTDQQEAREIVTFGRWIAQQCGTKDEAVRRLSKRLRGLAGASALPDLEAMIEAVAGSNLDERAEDAVGTIRRLLSAG